MNAKALRKLAGDPRFISGIYNYCDRWCERCPLSDRCLTYAMEKADDVGDPAARDISNKKFWDKLHGVFQQTFEMVRETAKERGIDLNDPKVRAEAIEHERAARRREVKNRPLPLAAMAYGQAVEKWMKKAEPLFAEKGMELET